MWEKFKNKMKNIKSSRALYVTVITLLLALSVLITATAIANRVKKNKGNAGENPPVSDGGDGSEDEGTPPADGGNTQEPPADSGDDGEASKPEDTKPTASVPELALPVSGSISKQHDTSIQVFSPTTGDYRIHVGVDMITAEDAPVLAAADGVISRIWDDALMGKCLAISHSGDAYTIYKNLDTELPEDITVGATVKAGQQLGKVGETAQLELAEEPHLHLEMTVKGLAVDPLEYFSQQALAALGKDNSHEVGATQPDAE